eukprot:8894984-Pyramimonas_sp.AAC.1
MKCPPNLQRLCPAACQDPPNEAVAAAGAGRVVAEAGIGWPPPQGPAPCMGPPLSGPRNKGSGSRL